MTTLNIIRGTTLHLSTAVGVGRIIDFTSSSTDINTETPHCLAAGDRIILCNVDDTCPQLAPGECVEVIEVLGDTKFRLSITLPDDTEGQFVKAAELNGFHLVLRLGSPSEEEYVNFGAVCSGQNQVVIPGCHDIAPGSKLSLGSAVKSSEVKKSFQGTDTDGQDYTIVILNSKATAKVNLEDNTFAVVDTPEQKEYHGRGNGCGIMAINLKPADTKTLNKGQCMPFTLSLERGWDMAAFNKKHGTDCPWKPDFSQLILSGVTQIG